MSSSGTTGTRSPRRSILTIIRWPAGRAPVRSSLVPFFFRRISIGVVPFDG